MGVWCNTIPTQSRVTTAVMCPSRSSSLSNESLLTGMNPCRCKCDPAPTAQGKSLPIASQLLGPERKAGGNHCPCCRHRYWQIFGGTETHIPGGGTEEPLITGRHEQASPDWPTFRRRLRTSRPVTPRRAKSQRGGIGGNYPAG